MKYLLALLINPITTAMDHNFTPYHIHEPPIPREILSELFSGTYLIAWHSDQAGIVHCDPEPIDKNDLAAEFPDIVEIWKEKQYDERREARQIEQKFLAFATQNLYGETDSEEEVSRGSEEVDCDQSLRPGMGEHWGEVRKCETHPNYRPAEWVCKGCRVAHYAQRETAFDRSFIMALGARVPVCAGCADEAVEMYMKKEEEGAKFKECKCDALWTCFRCREEELERLTVAGEEHDDESCGRCGAGSGLTGHVDFCLHCQGWRVYAATTEEMELEEPEDVEGSDEAGDVAQNHNQTEEARG